MRLLIVGTDYFPVRTSAAVQLEDLAIQLNSMGIQVVMLIPSGHLFHECSIQTRSNIQIIRLPSLRIKDVSYMRRLIGEVFLSFTMGIGMFLGRGSIPSKVDGIICYSPSIFFGPLLFFLKTKYNCRIYLILRDIFPQWAFDLGLIPNRAIYYCLKLIAHFQYQISDVIGVQSLSNLAYVNYLGNGKSEVLHNWLAKSSNTSCSINIQNTCLAGKKILVYAGNMGVAQNLDSLIHLAIKTSNQDNIGYVLVGRGSEVARLKLMSKHFNLSNVLFFEEIGSEEVDGLLKQCHAGLISLDMRHQTHNIPGKFLCYLRAGLPVIASVESKSDLSEMIRSQKVGFVIPYFDYESCIAAFQLLDDHGYYRDMKSNALRMVENYFSVEGAAQSICRQLKIKYSCN
jgi:glycosyltransferase involved in cell wall biosynthesis